MSALQVLQLVPIGLVGLGILVFIHELGHFLAARAVGIEVEAFALGWGPTLLRRKGRVTEYRLAAFPIGGYCKMKGEQDMVDALQNKTDHMTPSPGSFFGASPWKRIIVSLAGPLMNLLFAVIILGLIWWIGYSYTSPDNRIIMPSDYAALSASSGDQPANLDLYSAGSPAARAGLKTGDRIVAVNGKPTSNYKEFSSLIVVAAKQQLTIEIERNGERIKMPITPLMDPSSGAGKIGIYPWIEPVISKARGNALAAGLRAGDRIISINGQVVNHTIDISTLLKNKVDAVQIGVQRDGSQVELTFVPDQTGKGTMLDCEFRFASFHTPAMGPLEAAVRGTTESLDNLVLTVRSLGLLFQGLNPLKAISGPGRIVPLIGEVATAGFAVNLETGLVDTFKLVALISIALCFGNLLPIPALDGGQIILFVGEAISRKPLNPRFVQRYQIIGAVLVFGLLIMAVFGDVLYWIGL